MCEQFVGSIAAFSHAVDPAFAELHDFGSAAHIFLPRGIEKSFIHWLVRFSNSPVGRLVTRVDYSDYREVAGVKMPFKWTVTWLDGRSTYELLSVEPNVAVDASRAPSVPRRP